MSAEDSIEALVEFKLVLTALAERVVWADLSAAAARNGQRLPAGAQTALRAGAVKAVRELSIVEVAALCSGRSWEESINAGLKTGAWRRLLDNVVRRSFPPGAA